MAETEWNYDISQMPAGQEIEVLRVVKAYRWQDDQTLVVDPRTGRMFNPAAWRPLSAEQS